MQETYSSMASTRATPPREVVTDGKESSADKQLVERRPPEERKSVEGEAGKHCKANQPGVEEAIFCIVLRCDWSVACEHPARLDVTKLQTQISCLYCGANQYAERATCRQCGPRSVRWRRHEKIAGGPSVGQNFVAHKI